MGSPIMNFLAPAGSVVPKQESLNPRHPRADGCLHRGRDPTPLLPDWCGPSSSASYSQGVIKIFYGTQPPCWETLGLGADWAAAMAWITSPVIDTAHVVLLRMIQEASRWGHEGRWKFLHWKHVSFWEDTYPPPGWNAEALKNNNNYCPAQSFSCLLIDNLGTILCVDPNTPFVK